MIVLGAFLVLTLAPLGRRLDGVTAAATNGARWTAWFGATLGVAALGIIGAAFAVTYETGEMLLFFGLVHWARFGAVAGAAAGVFGVLTIVLSMRARSSKSLPLGTMLALLVTGLATVSLSVFLFVWDLGPF